MSTLGHQYDNSLVSNAFGFLRLPMNFQPYDSDADWVITGVPFDMATSGRAGGRHGPAAIRQVSTNLAWEHNRFPWNFDMRERLNVVDCGDLVYAFGDAREMSEKLQAHAEKLLAAGKRMLSFGGDHFVTLPLLRAHAKHFGKMALVHFDAHTDTYANGCEFDHGTMFYTAPNEGLIDRSRRCHGRSDEPARKPGHAGQPHTLSPADDRNRAPGCALPGWRNSGGRCGYTTPSCR